jgi:lipopolysaccharide export system protein LptA
LEILFRIARVFVMKRIFLFVLFLLVTISTSLVFGQANNPPKKIELIGAESAIYDKTRGEFTLLIGNVIFKHENIMLYCDSAYLYSEANSIDAFSNVHIKASDSVNIYGDSLKYSGNTKIAEIHKNVKLIDNEITLTTEHLTYDLRAKTGRYYDGGKIVDPDNTLTSKLGYYYSDNKDFFFNDSVVLVNTDYYISTDSMIYNTASKISHFYGPTFIFSKENIIYTQKGWYDTPHGNAEFTKKSVMRNKSQILFGDSICYNRREGVGLAYHHVMIFDSIRNTIVGGGFIRYDQKNQYSLATINARLVQIDENKDSLFLHADTLIGTFDTLTQKAKVMYAFHRVKFFRDDLQGMCDSLVYNYADSTIQMFQNPLIWTEDKQLSADSVTIYLSNSQVDKMILRRSSFLIAADDSTKNRFNQVKGINMTGFFKDGLLKKIKVFNNAETIYFMREADGKKTGINKAISTNMDIEIRDNKIFSISFLDKPVATLYPDKELTGKDLLLKDFKWLEKYRPRNKYGIFFWK